MKYVILGSGPSVEKYEPAGADVVISCHFALSEDTTHLCSNHIISYGWQPMQTITSIYKRDAIGTNTKMIYPANLKWEKRGTNTMREYPTTVCVDGLKVYIPEEFNTGVVAVLWCLSQPEVETVDLWGFDSLVGNRAQLFGGGRGSYKHMNWIKNHPKCIINI